MDQIQAVKQIKLNVKNIRSVLVSSNKNLQKLKTQKVSFIKNQEKEQEFRDREKKLESPLQSTISKVKSAVLQGPMSIFDKIKEFLGLILLGILVNNLPKIIEKIKNVYTKIEQFFNIPFIKGLGQMFSSFGNFVVAVAREISSFTSIQKSESEIEETKKILNDLNSQYDKEEKELSKYYDELSKQYSNEQKGEGEKPSGSPSRSRRSPRPPQPTPTPQRTPVSGESRQPIEPIPTLKRNKGGTIVPPSQDKETRKSIQKNNRSQSLPQGETGKQRRARETVNYFASFNRAVKQQSENIDTDKGNVKLFEEMTNNFKEFSILMDKMKDTVIPPPPPPGDQGPGGTPFIQMDGKLYEASGGSLPSAYFRSAYGMRRHPITGRERLHSGVDYSISSGTPVSVVQPGKVTYAQWNNGGYGYAVEVEHAGGLRSFYAHLSKVLVAPGQEVKPGTVIGNVGSTGESTGPHVHFELRKNGKAMQIPANQGDTYFRFGGNVTLKELVAGKGRMSIEQILELAKSVGFKGKNAEVAAAVAMAESNGDPSTDTVKSGTDPQMKREYSIGLWQINWKAHKDGTLKKMGITNPDMLRNPTVNARAALLISGGSDFGPWSVYSKSGSYKTYLPAAEKANRKSGGQGGSNSMNETIKPLNKTYNKLSSSVSYSESQSVFMIARQIVETPVVVPIPIPIKSSNAGNKTSSEIKSSNLLNLWMA